MNTEIDKIEIYHKLNTIKPKYLLKKSNSLSERMALIKKLEKQQDDSKKYEKYQKPKTKKENHGGNIIIYS